MKLIIPGFWYKKHIISYLLLPVSWLYKGLFALRRYFVQETVFNKLTITIGNVTVGGGGKTPTAIAVAELLKLAGIKSGFLTRGYLGRITAPVIVDSNHDARQVGDEALLLAKHATTIISKKRFLAQKLINQTKLDCVIMDDGLQNFTVKQHIKILVIDSDFLFGNGFLIPAGPLRENWQTAIKRVDYIIYIGDKDKIMKLNFYQEYSDKSFFAKYVVDCDVKQKTKKQWLAFAGLANNKKFFNSLTEYGYPIKQIKEFPDHHCYSDKDILRLLESAKRDKLCLITTSKDMVKIAGKYRKNITEFKIKLALAQEDEFLAGLKRKINE